MKNYAIVLVIVFVFCVACQRVDTPYAGIPDTESDKTAQQPDPGQIK